MSFTSDQKKALSDLEATIANAIKKVGARKENDLCKYIPVNSGGYMHHFTLKKMKSKKPQELSSLISKFIIEASKPSAVRPKQRAARGSRKKRDQITFTKNQLDRLLSIARLAGDKEMISVLSPKKSLLAIKKELINSIKHNRTEQELWNTYVEACNLANNSMEEVRNPFQPAL